MSRTNPGKKKRRAAGKTILVYGEGLSEEVFEASPKPIFI